MCVEISKLLNDKDLVLNTWFDHYMCDWFKKFLCISSSVYFCFLVNRSKTHHIKNWKKGKRPHDLVTFFCSQVHSELNGCLTLIESPQDLLAQISRSVHELDCCVFSDNLPVQAGGEGWKAGSDDFLWHSPCFWNICQELFTYVSI